MTFSIALPHSRMFPPHSSWRLLISQWLRCLIAICRRNALPESRQLVDIGCCGQLECAKLSVNSFPLPAQYRWNIHPGSSRSSVPQRPVCKGSRLLWVRIPIKCTLSPSDLLIYTQVKHERGSRLVIRTPRSHRKHSPSRRLSILGLQLPSRAVCQLDGAFFHASSRAVPLGAVQRLF